MYFPYPDKGGPAIKGAGSYFPAKASAPVEQTSGLGQGPAGYAPIRSPWFVQHTPWPYIRGPIYTRPVFKEYSRQGNFQPYPIVRMPSLKGLGEEATASSVCAAVQAIPDAYEKCMAFNAELANASEARRTEMNSQIQTATSACAHVTDFAPWANCFYTHLRPSWYENPWYLGGALVGGAAALSLVVLAIRRTAE